MIDSGTRRNRNAACGKVASPPRSSRGARSLERQYLCGDDVWQAERQTIFGRWWICLGRAAEWPARGSFRCVDVADHPVVVVRSTDGTIQAFHNVCRHRGSAVVTEPEGTAQRGVLACPYHNWTYDLDGRLIGAPNMADAEGFCRDGWGLKKVGAIEWQGFVMVNLDPGASREHLDELDGRLAPWGIADLESRARLSYDVAANWKLLFQNYSECYHCPTVHPALNRLTPYQNSSNDAEAGPVLGGPMELADGVATMSSGGARVGIVFPGLSERQQRQVYYYTIFPTIFLSLHPDYVMTHTIEPLAIDCTRVVCEFLFDRRCATTSGLDPAPAIEFWDTTNRQDWRVCELAQRGVRSPAFEPGPYANLESMVAAFDRHYLHALGEPAPRTD